MLFPIPGNSLRGICFSLFQVLWLRRQEPKNRIRISALLFAFFAIPATATGIISATDGAGLLFDHGRMRVHIRLANIAAPATGQAYAAQSTQSLADLCVGKAAGFFKGAADENGRIVWIVMCNGVNVNREQVRRGLAKVNPHRNTDPALPSLEATARKAKLGVWANPQQPLPGRRFEQDKTTERVPFNWRPENPMPGATG
jgi:endonuclease YncB( thermonuclease family)